MNPAVYLNGHYLPAGEARISTIDMAYLYGYGVFESLRIYDGIPFRLERHLTRLAKGATFLGIDKPNPKMITKAVYELIERNACTHGRVRITLSMPGVGIVPALPEKRSAALFIATMPIEVPSIERSQVKGVTAIISRKVRRTRGELSSIKVTAQLSGIVAQSEAHNAGAEEAILLNDKDTVAEGSFSNIFAVKNGKLITPDLKSGILPGITREIVLALAKQSGITTEEIAVKPAKLIKANEIFLTSSIREIVPIVRLNGKAIGSGRPGITTKRLIAAYKALVKKETAR